MADGDRYPLLQLGTPRALARKKVKPSFPRPPARNVVAHGRALLAGAEAARQRLVSAVAVSRDLATDVPYVRIQPELRHVVSDADLARLGLVPVMHRHDHVIAAYATDVAVLTRTRNRSGTCGGARSSSSCSRLGLASLGLPIAPG